MKAVRESRRKKGKEEGEVEGQFLSGDLQCNNPQETWTATRTWIEKLTTFHMNQSKSKDEHVLLERGSLVRLFRFLELSYRAFFWVPSLVLHTSLKMHVQGMGAIPLASGQMQIRTDSPAPGPLHFPCAIRMKERVCWSRSSGMGCLEFRKSFFTPWNLNSFHSLQTAHVWWNICCKVTLTWVSADILSASSRNTN